jgi:hypothetical protein
LRQDAKILIAGIEKSARAIAGFTNAKQAVTAEIPAPIYPVQSRSALISEPDIS